MYMIYTSILIKIYISCHLYHRQGREGILVNKSMYTYCIFFYIHHDTSAVERVEIVYVHIHLYVHLRMYLHLIYISCTHKFICTYIHVHSSYTHIREYRIYMYTCHFTSVIERVEIIYVHMNVHVNIHIHIYISFK